MSPNVNRCTPGRAQYCATVPFLVLLHRSLSPTGFALTPLLATRLGAPFVPRYVTAANGLRRRVAARPRRPCRVIRRPRRRTTGAARRLHRRSPCAGLAVRPSVCLPACLPVSTRRRCSARASGRSRVCHAGRRHDPYVRGGVVRGGEGSDGGEGDRGGGGDRPWTCG